MPSDELFAPPADSPAPTSGGLSDLAAVRAEIDAVVLAPARLIHPLLPSYTLVFRTDMDRAELDRIRKPCRGQGNKQENFDFPKFDSMVLNALNVGIEKDGAPLIEDGEDVTFSTRAFQAAFDVNTGADAAKFFLRTDAALATMCNACLEAVGFNREVESATGNPTTGR